MGENKKKGMEGGASDRRTEAKCFGQHVKGKNGGRGGKSTQSASKKKKRKQKLL